MKWATENSLTLERHWGLPGSLKCAVLESLETRPSSQMRVHGTRGAAVFAELGGGAEVECIAWLPCPHFRPHLSGLTGFPLVRLSQLTSSSVQLRHFHGCQPNNRSGLNKIDT